MVSLTDHLSDAYYVQNTAQIDKEGKCVCFAFLIPYGGLKQRRFASVTSWAGDLSSPPLKCLICKRHH